ncbi:MAG: vanadium-dependent haloperoxidase [Williamsia sp.]|nr:vanadium-dependent haloperoxidase [Williamsia sp.]
MKQFCILFFSCCLTASLFALPNGNWKQKAESPDFLHRAVKQVTDVIVYDIYSPPVASRIYAYVAIAGYEAAMQQNPHYISFAGQLHDLNPVPADAEEYCYALASVQAILSVGKALIISENRIEDFRKRILQEFEKTGMPRKIFDNSLLHGKVVADHILEWAARDNYKQTRSSPKYSVAEDEGTWKPTPPAYFKAVEPHWNEIRTFVIDSAQEFQPLSAVQFSTEKNSQFYKEALKVYDAGLKLTLKQKQIALFWDCNPFKMNIHGHVMYATKKISPGGHWMNITRIACKKAGADFFRSAEAYAWVAIALADSFISCWDEKYRSNVIRPETYINQYIDGHWIPLLQTPPFPEYTSGHSVISTTASIVLTKLFGKNFSFVDSSETEFGLPVRTFSSFEAAALEAANSRFYGGIHYMPSILNGIAEGREIGDFMLLKLKTRR